MSKYVRVPSLPDCDLCGDPARLDVKTTQGPWANLCPTCARTSGLWTGNLGTGIGQALVVGETEELAISAALLGFTVVFLEPAIKGTVPPSERIVVSDVDLELLA